MTRPIMILWDRYCVPVTEQAGVVEMIRGALTWRTYDVALRLAVFYPIMSMLLWWIAKGQAGQIGSAILLPEQSQFWPARFASIAAIVVGFMVFAPDRLSVPNSTGSVSRFLRWLPVFGIPLAVGTAVIVMLGSPVKGEGAFEGAFAGVVAVGCLFFFSGAGAVLLAGAAALSFASLNAYGNAMAFLVVCGVALVFLEDNGRFRAGRLMVSIVLIGLWLSAPSQLDWTQSGSRSRSIFVFLAVFPLLNAIVDALSYAITLALIRRGLRTGMPLIWGIVDVFAALVLFLGLGAILVTVIAGLNRFAGAPLLDFGTLFADIWLSWQVDELGNTRSHIWDYAWVYTMLFSSALPTVIHLLVSLIGLQGITPRSWRMRLADRLESKIEGSGVLIIQAGLLSIVWFVPFIFMGVCAGILWWIGFYSGVFGFLAEEYFNALLWLADLEGVF